MQLGTCCTREHADSRASGGERREHLLRHLLRIGTHAFGGDAVIGGRHDDGGPETARIRRMADSGDAGGELLESPEAAARLGLRIERTLSRLGGVRIRALDPGERLQQAHCSDSMRPATTKAAWSAAPAHAALTRPSTSR